jgi:hypothetical protein
VLRPSNAGENFSPHIKAKMHIFATKRQNKTKCLERFASHRHGKLFIGRPCKKRADGLLELSRHQLEMVIAVLTGHAPVRMYLFTISLFEGDPTCRFCRKEAETVQHMSCCCSVLACQRFNIFGNPDVEPKDTSTASVRDPLPLHNRHRVIESVLNGIFRVAQ